MAASAPLSLVDLPAEVIEQIALDAALLHPTAAPSTLHSLLCVNHSIHDLLNPATNAALYATLFRSRFDVGAIYRRFGKSTLATSPTSSNHPRDGEEPHRKRAKHEGSLVLTSASSESQSFATAILPSLPQHLMTSKDSSQLGNDTFTGVTPRQLADEFMKRISLLKRIRHCALVKQLEPLRGCRPITSNTIIPHDQLYAIDGVRPLTSDLWAVYLMVLENDGLNVAQLIHFAQIQTFLSIYHDEEIKAAAILPGYPQDTPERCLAMHLTYHLVDADSQHPLDESASEERFFILRPYVFAAHVFDAYFAPWTIRQLPLPLPPPVQATSPFYGPIDAPDLGEEPFLANLKPQKRIHTLDYLGHSLHITPPILCHAACRSFFLQVDRESDAVSDRQELISLLRELTRPEPSSPTDTSRDDANNIPTPDESSLQLSKSHDKDFERLITCLDPYSSKGLDPLFHLGDFVGAWEGRFSFFDFDSYCEMLSGRMLSLFQGPFGDQPQVWKLQERIRRIRDGQIVKFQGQNDNKVVVEKKKVNLSTQAGKQMCQNQELKGDEEEEDVEFDCDEDYEIELFGSGHSAWGQFTLQGSIRAWDGMFRLSKEYTPDGRGRWLYRGYAVAGGVLVGRWRDTFTPERLSGYEGTFLMRKRA